MGFPPERPFAKSNLCMCYGSWKLVKPEEQYPRPRWGGNRDISPVRIRPQYNSSVVVCFNPAESELLTRYDLPFSRWVPPETSLVQHGDSSWRPSLSQRSGVRLPGFVMTVQTRCHPWRSCLAYLCDSPFKERRTLMCGLRTIDLHLGAPQVGA